MSAADDLRALTAVATPGPWEVSKRNTYRGKVAATGWGASVFTTVDPFDIGNIAIPRAAKDAELIVWLRNHADALADLIAAARAVETAQFSSRPGDLVRAVMGLSDPLTALEAR